MLVSSFTSGIGLLLIVPLIASVGIDLNGGTNSTNNLVDTINSIIHWFGISPTLGTVLTIYLVLITFMATLNLLNTLVSSSLKQTFIVHLRDQLARKLFFTQWRYLNSTHVSDFMRLLTGQVGVASSSLYLLMTLVSSAVLVVVYLTLSLYLSPALTLVAALCGLSLIALLWPVNKRLNASGAGGLRANRDIHRAVFENVANLKIIKSFAAEDRYLERMHQSNQELGKQQLRLVKIGALTRFVNMVGAAIIFTILFYSAIQWLSLPIANLLVILLIFSRLMPQFASIQTNVQSLIHQAPSYRDLIEREEELSTWSEPHDSGVQAPILRNKIVLKGVSYQYVDASKPAISCVNATIYRNQTVAIVGPSGTGKSTLTDIIAGLTEPSEGEIWVDDCLLEARNRIAWRQEVAYVTQDVFLFHDTIRANLSWVIENKSVNEDGVDENLIWRALELASASEFVRGLPDGLDTLIGDRGVKLSGGERQRIALARALISEPEILILDEATSALDRENELKIRDALLKLDGRLTIIIIAHNETTIEHVSNRIEI